MTDTVGDLRERSRLFLPLTGVKALVVVPDETWLSSLHTSGEPGGLCVRGPFVLIPATGNEAITWIRAAALGDLTACLLFAKGQAVVGQETAVVVADHLNLTGENPLKGPNLAELGVRFPDMTEPYDPELRSGLRDIAPEAVVAGVLDASDPEHQAMGGRLGYTVVAEDLVHAAIAARHAGLRVAACVTTESEGRAELLVRVLDALRTSVSA